MSYKRFCGLVQATNIPDRTTIWNFKNRIGEPGAKALLCHGAALEAGLHRPWRPDHRRHPGAGPEAALSKDDKAVLKDVALPADWKPAKRRQKDVDATWTKKHGKSYFGYKLPVNVDKLHKFIRKIVTDTASPHDSRHFDAVMDRANTSRNVYADRGYPSEEREAWLKANGYQNRIQRKGKRNKPLSETQQGRNHRIAKTRARVEHAFAAIEQMGGKLIRTIGQARANFALTMMAACYNLKRLAYFQQVGIVPA
jgi:IS5 family transposase